MTRELILAAFVASISLSFSACEKQGPAERAGEKVDHAVDTMRNGGEEPLSDRAEDAAHDLRQGVEEAGEDVRNE